MRKELAFTLACLFVLGGARISCTADPAAVPITAIPTTDAAYNPVGVSHGWLQECKDRVAAKKGKPVDIIFIGDSITQNWATLPNASWGAAGGNVWQHWYAKRNALAFGVGADKTQDVLWRLSNMNIQQFHPKVAVILVGTNNTMNTAPDIAAGIKAVVHKTQEDFPGVKIILVSILPRVGPNDLMLEANALVKPIVDNSTIFYFDLNSLMTPVGDNYKGISADHVHPLPAGYELWAEAMEPLLDRLLAMKSPSPEIAAASITHRIACIGDSITAGVGASDDDDNYPSRLAERLGPQFQVANFGESGATLLKSGDSPYWQRDSFVRSALFQPNSVIIMLGTNDSKPQNWTHQSDFAADYSALLDYYAALPSHPHLYVCLPPPVAQSAYGIVEGPVEEEIPLIKQVAAQKGATVIDVHGQMPNDTSAFVDGVHPNDAGYAILADTVYQGITQAPLILPMAGAAFYDPISVTLKPPSPNTQIRYTTNGSIPTLTSPLYRSPFLVKMTTTVKAQAFAAKKPVGMVSEVTYTHVEPLAAQMPANTVPGLRYTYFEGPFQSVTGLRDQAPAATGTSPDFSLTPHKQATNFGFRWDGYVTVPASGLYTFGTNSDDGSSLAVDGRSVVDNDGAHGAQTSTGQIALARGKHAITVFYFQGTGDYSLHVTWQGPNFPMQDIQPDALTH